MKTKLFLAMLMLSVCGKAQLPAFEWAVGSDGSGKSVAKAVTTDSAGNIVVTGFFENTVDFNPGTEKAEFTSLGYRDIFIEKFNSNGIFLWAKQIGSKNNDYGYSAVCDKDGNIYVTGTYGATADFDPGDSTYNLTPKGWNDIYVLKLDTDGNFIWATGFDGTDREQGNAITIDKNGDLLVTGKFEGDVDFDPDPDSLLNIHPAGRDDVFILKLSNDADLIWVKQLGGTQIETGNAIATDNENNIVVTGYFEGTVDFDPDENETKEITSLGGHDIFVVKLDSNGNLIWVKQMGGDDHQEANGVDIDAGNNIFIAGTFRDTADFDPGSNVEELIAMSEDIFIENLDQDGNFRWVNHIGNNDWPQCFDIVCAGNGNLYITGGFQYTIDLDPGYGVYEQTSNGGYDIFVEELTSDGEFVWAGTMGGKNNYEYGFDICTDKNNNIITAGVFNSDADFDPGTDTIILDNKNIWGDLFVQKLNHNSTATIISDKTEDNNKIIVYPNPSYGYVNVSFGGKIEDAKIEIFNISGMTVETINVSDCNSYTLNIHHGKGIYLVKVTTGNKSEVFRLLVK